MHLKIMTSVNVHITNFGKNVQDGFQQQISELIYNFQPAP